MVVGNQTNDSTSNFGTHSAAGLLSNLRDEVLCAALAPPATAMPACAGVHAARTAQPDSVTEGARGASPAAPWLLLTDGILPECCAALSAGNDEGNVYSHVHELRTMTVCLGRIASALQVRCQPICCCWDA